TGLLHVRRISVWGLSTSTRLIGLLDAKRNPNEPGRRTDTCTRGRVRYCESVARTVRERPWPPRRWFLCCACEGYSRPAEGRSSRGGEPLAVVLFSLLRAPCVRELAVPVRCSTTAMRCGRLVAR